MQKRLNDVLITFTYAEVKQLPNVFSQYDFIYLSNILSYDHWVFNSDDREYLAEQYAKLVSDIYTKNLENNQTELNRVSIKLNSFTSELFEITVAGEVIKTTRKHQFYIIDKLEFVYHFF